MAKKKAKKSKAPPPESPAPPKKKRLGRPRIQIDETVLRALAQVNCTYEEIAAYFGIAKSTLHKRYRTSIEKWRNQNKASLRRTQWAMALGKIKHRKVNEDGSLGPELDGSGYTRLPNITMLIWLGKQELGQREPDKGDPQINPDEKNRPVTGSDLLQKKIVIKRMVVKNADHH